MKIFKLQFLPVSPITKIPDSQTFFGALCTAIKDIYGRDKLESFLKEMETKEYPFILSSFFYANTFPMPLDINPEFLEEKDINIKDIALLKKIKKVERVSTGVFEDYIKNFDEFNNKFYKRIIAGEYLFIPANNLLIKVEERQEYFSKKLSESITRTRNKVNYKKEKDTDLFYNNIIYLDDTVIFDAYIKVKDEDVFEVILNSLEKYKYLSIGGKRSIGMNLFEFIGYSEFFNVDFKDKKLLLSKCILDSDEVDFKNSYYKIMHLNNKFDNNSESVYKHSLSVFVEGSVFNTSQTIIGDVVKEKGEHFDIYHNAIGFLI